MLTLSNRRCPFDYPKIKIENHLIALKLLRNFGHTIADIEINHSGFIINPYTKNFRTAEIEFYLVEYCSKSLEKLTLDGRKLYERSYGLKTLFEDTGKPFPNLRVLCVKWCSLGPKVLNKFFPNLESLELVGVHYKSSSVIKEYFPKLKKLKFSESFMDYELFPEDDVMEMIKLNSQLEELDILNADHYTPKIIGCIREHLPAIKYFRFYCGRHPPYSPKNMPEPFHFNDVVDFEIGTHHVSNINFFTFSKLERFVLVAVINLDDNHTLQQILNFIHRNTNLKSIILEAGGDHIHGNLNRLFESVSNIEELSILRYRYNTIDWETPDIEVCSILQFLKCNQSLKKIVITGSGSFDYTRNRQICKAFALHTIEYKIITERQIYYEQCECCRDRYFASIKFKIKKTKNSMPTTYNCIFMDDIDDLRVHIVSMEFTKIE